MPKEHDRFCCGRRCAVPLGRTPAYHLGGRGLESRRSRHFDFILIMLLRRLASNPVGGATSIMIWARASEQLCLPSGVQELLRSLLLTVLPFRTRAWPDDFPLHQR